MLILGAWDLDGDPLCLRIDNGIIVEAAKSLTPNRDDYVVDANGCTVIPGLHDHHVHLRAIAAALNSITVGPPDVTSEAALAEAMEAATAGPTGWIRGIGFHESVTNNFDRHALDRLRNDVPVRVQHRSGAMWILNSAALDAIGESDHPDGKFFRLDDRMKAFAGIADNGLGEVSARLGALGITGCTDATPSLSVEDLDYFDDEIHSGRFHQQLHVLVAPQGEYRNMTFGPVKRILDDTDLDYASFSNWVTGVHASGRAVAVHCVTLAQLVLTIAVLDSVGVHPQDRIEHGAMSNPETTLELARLGVLVVTQPSFIAERGDHYLTDVEASDHDHLWRVQTFINAGVKVAGSTDAPFCSLDPWMCMRAARDRTTPTGHILAPKECVSARVALSMFLGRADNPARLRTLTPGEPGNLCILDASPVDVLDKLTAQHVRTTIVSGEVVFHRPHGFRSSSVTV